MGTGCGYVPPPHSGQKHAAHLINALPGHIQNHLPFAPGDNSSARKYVESPGKKREGCPGSGGSDPTPFMPQEKKGGPLETLPGASQPVEHEGLRGKGEKF